MAILVKRKWREQDRGEIYTKQNFRNLIWKWSDLEQHACEASIVKFEMSFVIEFEQCRAVRMVFLQMKIMYLRLRGCVATVLTYIHLYKRTKMLFTCWCLVYIYVLPWIFSVCSHTGVQHHELLSNDSQANISGWKISHKDYICMVERLQKVIFHWIF